MYFLISYDAENNIKIVGNCYSNYEKFNILKSYLDINSINLVNRRSDINNVCKNKNSKFAYSNASRDEYIVLKCEYTEGIFYDYVKKEELYRLKYLYYRNNDVINNKKLINNDIIK